MTDIKNKLATLIADEAARQAGLDKHGWRAGKFKLMRELQTDKRGDVGEEFVVWMLTQIGKEAFCSSRTDPTRKHWDIYVKDDDISLEVKTATLGYATNNFQHENLEQNRDCDGIVFFDIAPSDLYITFMCKATFAWSAAHRRRHGIHFKKDLSLKWLRENNKQLTSADDFARGGA